MQLWGGLQTAEMDQALARHGVAIHDSIRNPRSVSGPKPDRSAVDCAIEIIQSAGLDVSERSVRGALVGLRRSASTEAIRARLRKLRESGALPQAKRTRAAGNDDPALQATEEAPAPRAVQSQNQGQETGVDARSASPLSSHLTAPNSHKDTNREDSAQSDASVEPQKQGQETEGECSFSPVSDDPSDDELEDLLQQAADDIEADLVQGPDPDDDLDPAGPGGSGGRRGGRHDWRPGGRMEPAASPHIHHNTWRSGVSPPAHA